MIKDKYDLVPLRQPGMQTLLGSEEGVSDLPFIPIPDGGFYSVWYTSSIWARLIFLFTGTLGFYCLASQHPPVSISIGEK